MRTRRTRIGIFSANVKTSWADSQLVLLDLRGDEWREVCIHFSSPSELAYIRDHLDKIEKYWKDQLVAYRSR